MKIHHYHHFDDIEDSKLVTLFVNEVRQLGERMNAQIQTFVNTVNGHFATVNTGLDNITADLVNLAQQIAALKAHIEANPGSTLAADDQAALDQLVTDAGSIASKTKVIADAVPDTVQPPPGA